MNEAATRATVVETTPAATDDAPKGAGHLTLPVVGGAAALSPLQMLDSAIARGASDDMLVRLMDLQERHERNEARRAFDHAIAAARADIPPIIKNRKVDFTSNKGRTNYDYEDLGEIARTVDPILAKHGLSYRFRTTSDPNEPVSVTCIVSHEMGHREENTLRAGRDESGNKNSIQAIGSTITFLQRYTLKSALGLAAAPDDDGAEAGTVAPTDADALRQLVDAAGRSEDQIVEWCNAKFKLQCRDLRDLPAKHFNETRAFLQGFKQGATADDE